MLIKVKVFVNSNKTSITKKSEDHFEIRVKEKAERGVANKAVLAALALHLHLSAGKIRLVRGSKQRNKIFEVRS